MYGKLEPDIYLFTISAVSKTTVLSIEYAKKKIIRALNRFGYVDFIRGDSCQQCLIRKSRINSNNIISPWGGGEWGASPDRRSA